MSDDRLECAKGCGQHLEPYWRWCPACGQHFEGGAAANIAHHRVRRVAAPAPQEPAPPRQPHCATCGANVTPSGGNWWCESCGKLTAMVYARPAPAPEAPSACTCDCPWCVRGVHCAHIVGAAEESAPTKEGP